MAVTMKKKKAFIVATASIICLVLLAPTLFLVSTTGYDKVIELLKQIGLLVK